jgi:hypothetical protein
MRRRGAVSTVWLAVAAVVLHGCAVDGLAFVEDKRVRLVSPGANDTVRLPFELRWTATDVDGSFAVFFDRAPIRPGRSLRALVPEGDVCRTDPACPDAAWLEERDVYVTTETRLVVEHLADQRDNTRQDDRHDVTIVLLDERGRRNGEAAFTREFTVERED